jgi:hypothetical protein
MYPYGLFGKSFGELLCILKKLLPIHNELPSTAYEDNQMRFTHSISKLKKKTMHVQIENIFENN